MPTVLPKLYTDIAEHNSRLRQFFAPDLERPVVIVGNGPSSEHPFAEDRPDAPLIFRMNWFFLENTPLYGRTVDAYFWGVNTPPMQEELAAVIKRGDYEVRAFMSPMRVYRLEGKEEVQEDRFEPWFDHWAIIAENQTLAREFMGRPLPTQGFQALAFALALGFREIYLTGIDLYYNPTVRYPYQIPPRLARLLPDKDLLPGYEKAHDYERDLSFFETCRRSYPDAAIHALSSSPFLDTYLRRRSPTGPTRGMSSPRPEPPHEPGTIRLLGGTRKRLEDLDSSDEPGYCKRIDGVRCAYATFAVGPGYSLGARALANSIAKHSDVPVVVLCLSDTNRRILDGPNIVTVDVEPLENPNTESIDSRKKHFVNTYTKLRVFQLEQWDRIVFIDSDAIMLHNCDELFAVSCFAAAPDIGLEIHYERFNSGVLCCQPSAATFEDMLRRLSSIESYDGGDQGFLNEFFPDAKLIDRRYNTLKRVYVHHPNLFRIDDVKILHYVGDKPWEAHVRTDQRYSALHRLWFEHIDCEYYYDLVSAPRAAKRPRESSPPSRRHRKLRKLIREPRRFFLDSRWIRPWLG